MRPTALSFLLLFLMAMASPAPAVAQATIKVIVNDKAITSYDINQRARLIRLTQRKSAAASRRDAEQELIDDQIKLTEADRLGISVSSSQVDNAYGNLARNVKLSTSQLSQALRQGGVNPQTLKDRLRAQIAWQQTVQRRFRSQINISESEVIAALRKSDDETKNVSIEYNLQQLIVVVPAKSSKSFRNQRLRESNAIRREFNGCEDPGAVLGQYKEVVMKPIGRRLETEIPSPLRERIGETDPGRLTQPVPTDVGYEMVAVCGKREIASDIAARTAMESELREREGESLSRRYLMELRRSATIVER